MSKFISKQSVAIWYPLTALFATYIVGQVILWCFPDGSSMGGSLLFILMNLIPMITALCFSIVLGESKSLGEFFKKVFLHPHHLLWDLHPAHECSLYWKLPLGLLTLFPLDLIIWRSRRSRLALVFTRASFL